MQIMSFVMACNSFFGRKPGQTLQDFNTELKALTQKDREDLAEMFKSQGILVKAETIVIAA